MAALKHLPNHKELLESETISIYHDFKDDWIYADWNGPQTVESVKQGCEMMLQFIIAERCHKLLNDNTRVTNIWSDAADWIASDFAPRCYQAGLQYVAWVCSPDEFSKLSTQEVLDRHHTPLVTITFNNIESAKDWLRSVS